MTKIDWLKNRKKEKEVKLRKREDFKNESESI